MRLSKRNLWLLLGVIVVAATVHWVTVAVGEQPGKASKADGKPEGPMIRMLDLSGSAAEAVAKEEKAFRRDMRKLERQVQIETLKLATLIEADETTEEQLKAQFEAVSNAQVTVHRRIASHVIAIRPYLDAEQRARFNGLVAGHFRGRGGPQPGMPGPGGPGVGGPGGPGRPGLGGPSGRGMGGPGGPGMRAPGGPEMGGPGMGGPGGPGMSGGPAGPGMRGAGGPGMGGPGGPGMQGPEGRPGGPGRDMPRGPGQRGPAGPRGQHGPQHGPEVGPQGPPHGPMPGGPGPFPPIDDEQVPEQGEPL